MGRIISIGPLSNSKLGPLVFPPRFLHPTPQSHSHQNSHCNALFGEIPVSHESMDQPWESLDVDDSDLCSFLLPSRPFAPCSSRSAVVSVPSRSPNPDPTPISVPPAELSGQKTEGKWRNEGKIPGPAGAVQSAMRRRAEKDFDLVEEEGIRGLGTQEYLRRAVEGGGNQEDFDFSFEEDAGDGTWVRAVEFVRERGLVEGDGVSIGMPLCNIKRGVALDKVSQVVALVKSCTPNGLGDLLVTLKDPTGTISASIHRNVLLDGGFGKVIAPGAALILQKVAVFSHARSSCYLNITLNNIVQVISKDGRLPSTRKEPAPAVTNSSNSDFIKDNENTGMVGVESSQTGERNRGDTMSSFRESENEPENDFMFAQSQQSKATQQSHAAVCHKQRTINPDASTQREPLLKSNDVGSRIGITSTISKSSNDNVRGIFASLQAKLCSSSGASFTSENSEHGRDGSRIEAVADDKGGNTNGKENQRQTPTQRTSIPEWTDEQLDELLDFD